MLKAFTTNIKAEYVITYHTTGSQCGLICFIVFNTGWGENSFTVVHMEIIQYLINNNTIINCIFHTHNCKPPDAPPCIINLIKQKF